MDIGKRNLRWRYLHATVSLLVTEPKLNLRGWFDE